METTSLAAANAGTPPHAMAPDFFIVGHPKSGTTSLWRALRPHPEVFMPIKEPWFFAGELKSAPTPRPRGTGRTPGSLEEYLALFAGARPGQRVGEASTPYLWSRTAASEIARLNPQAKIVAILREPASFLRSLHLQFVQVYLEPEKDLRRALALEDARRAGTTGPQKSYWPGALLYSDHVRYVEQLRRYRDLFAAEQVLVLIYEDYRADNAETVRRLHRFLEVDDSLPVRVRDSNPTVQVRSRRLHGLAHAIANGQGALPRALRRGATALAGARVSSGAAVALRDRLLFTSPAPSDERLMSELRVRFRGEVSALSEYLGRDLIGLWGYDELP